MSRAGHAIADMAYFPVRDQKPAEYCRAQVRDCDVYVGLIGLRYGTPVRDQPEVSYTELEFDAATEASLPRLVFLLDEEQEVPIPARWLLNSDPDLRARQRAFRARLRDSGMVTGTFSSPQQLGLLVLRALTDLRRERQPGMARRLPQRPEFVFGRKDLLAELHARLTGRSGRARDRRAVRAWRRGEDQCGGRVRVPAPGGMRGGMAAACRGTGRAGGWAQRAGRATRRQGRPQCR